MIEPLTSRNKLRSIQRPPSSEARMPAKVVQKSWIGVHSKMKTNTDATWKARTKAPQAIITRLNDAIGKMRYKNNNLIGY